MKVGDSFKVQLAKSSMTHTQRPGVGFGYKSTEELEDDELDDGVRIRGRFEAKAMVRVD